MKQDKAPERIRTKTTVVRLKLSPHYDLQRGTWTPPYPYHVDQEATHKPRSKGGGTVKATSRKARLAAHGRRLETDPETQGDYAAALRVIRQCGLYAGRDGARVFSYMAKKLLEEIVAVCRGLAEQGNPAILAALPDIRKQVDAAGTNPAGRGRRKRGQ